MACSSPERIADTSMASGETMLEAARDKSINSSFLVRWAFSSGLGLSRLRGTVRCINLFAGARPVGAQCLATAQIMVSEHTNAPIATSEQPKKIILANCCESLDARRGAPGPERPRARSAKGCDLILRIYETN